MLAAKEFTDQDRRVWRSILSQHETCRESQICDLFLSGVRTLRLTPDETPNLDEINRVLEQKSGFKGVYVKGLEDGANFYRMLASREFPVGNFIRDARDLGYTPEPDVVHDLYGHLPFFTDRDYGEFCRKFGEASLEFLDRPHLFRQFERFFWFTVEFGLIRTPKGPRVFGAGIASSTGECEYALSGRPEVFAFDIDRVRQQEFRIDEMQPRLFILENVEQLYQSLPELVARVRADA